MKPAGTRKEPSGETAGRVPCSERCLQHVRVITPKSDREVENLLFFKGVALNSVQYFKEVDA